MKARLIAHYLPQFHPIPENDRWWGKGFTEWTNTAKAKKLFPDHSVPNIPADLGYYDLRVSETRIQQAELAQAYGIEGFVYWHYWFGDGKRLLERPFLEVLRSGTPEFPFCLAWANHTWSGIWHGTPDKILIKRPWENDIKAHFYSLLDAFKDPRYIKLNGRNIFCVYRPSDLLNADIFMSIWRDLARKENAPDFHFIGIVDYPWSTKGLEYDGYTTNPPVGQLPYQKVQNINNEVRNTLPENELNKPLPQIYSYQQFIDNAFPDATRNEKFYPCVMPNWDNTPRSGENGFVLQESTPALYEKHLREAIDLVKNRRYDENLIFVKSWNEWAEGNYLEPDLKHGHAYLQATLNALK